MYICQLPESIQTELRKDITAYIEANWCDDWKDDIIQSKEDAIDHAMSEKLFNVLDLDDDTREYGLTWEKYRKLLEEVKR